MGRNNSGKLPEGFMEETDLKLAVKELKSQVDREEKGSSVDGKISPATVRHQERNSSPVTGWERRGRTEGTVIFHSVQKNQCSLPM